MPLRFNPENESENEDDEDEELEGLMNWPPSRGPIDPYLPRMTFIPHFKRVTSFQRPARQPNMKNVTGQWQVLYRVLTVRTLTLEQAITILTAEPINDADRYDFWMFEWRSKEFPTFTVEISTLPTPDGEFALPNAYQFIIEPCTEKAVRTSHKTGKAKKAKERSSTSPGYVMWMLSKELEKLYIKYDLKGYSDLYFQQLDIKSTGLIRVTYKTHQSPRELALDPLPEIQREEFDLEVGALGPGASPRPPQIRLSRGNTRKLRACNLLGNWRVNYTIVSVGSLTLQQAHELLHTARWAREKIEKGHPLFEKYQERELRLQAETAEHLRSSIAREETEEEEIEEDEWNEVREKEEDSFEMIIQKEKEYFGVSGGDEHDVEHFDYIQYYCPDCGEKDIERSQEESFVGASCNNCESHWHEPYVNVFTRSYRVSAFDFWSACRAGDAPTLVVDIDYPLRKLVRLTIPPANFKTNLGEFHMMSPGYFMWVIAKEYRRIYEHHEDYGIWGHGISDLVFELIDVQESGHVDLAIGS